MADAVYNFTGSKYYILVVNDFQRNVYNFYIDGSLPLNNITDSNVLARIPLANPKNTIGFDEGSDLIPKKRQYFGPVTLEKLKFLLLDEFGREVDLNNANYSLALELECVYNL